MPRGGLKNRVPLDLQSYFLFTKEKVREANTLRLLTWIKDELDPKNFSLEEIFEEGWVGISATNEPFNSEAEIPKLLSTLCSNGLVEKRGDSYELTEKGLQAEEFVK